MPPRTGSLNRNKDRLLKALQKEWGDDFDPIMKAARIAHDMTEALDNMDSPDTAAMKSTVDSWVKIAEFVQPKLKAVEVSMGEDEDGKQQVWQINIVKGD